MPAKALIVLFFGAIVFSLCLALRRLLQRNSGNATVGNPMLRALVWRIALAVLLFSLLWLMAKLGILLPHRLGDFHG